MEESEFDCCESSDDEYLYSNNTNDHKLKDTEITPFKLTNCNKDLKGSDNEQEIEIEIQDLSEKFQFKESFPNVTESSDVKLNSKYNKQNVKEKDPSDERRTPNNDMNDQNPVNQRSVVNRNRKLNKFNTIDSSDPNYQFGDKIKQMNTFFSVDKSPDVENYAEKTSSVKRLSVDPEFQQKMKDLYYPMPNSALYSNNKTFSDFKTDIKNNFNRLNSNCEIVEENLSPVSTTAKNLEHQLSFSAAPKSPSLYPRIPKLTRFARLNRFLSVSPESDGNNSEFVDIERKD